MVRCNAQIGLLAIAAVVLLLGACGDDSDDAPGTGGAAVGDSGPDIPGGPDPGDDPGDDGGDTGTGPRTADPIPVPDRIEAEDFDIGGDYVGYHDNVPGNQGGEYRPGEDVDIVTSRDVEGGDFDVTSFEAGEWLAYTIQATETTDYDIALRVSGASADSAVRIEVDGVDVSGSVSVPSTGSADSYLWLHGGRRSLTAGPHYLKVHAERAPFVLNSLRVSAAPTPYTGTAFPIPGSFEAEHFDRGGAGAGYHDATAGNQGDAAVRVTEDVDIFTSADTLGAHEIRQFEAGEWLGYTIDVATPGDYVVEVRAATHADFPDSGYRILVDGVDATGPVVLPNTGGWTGFQWVGPRVLALGAGTHRLTVVSERPYFALNSIRLTQAVAAPPEPDSPLPLPPLPPVDQTGLLFKSGFEGAVILGLPLLFGNGAWQDITGLDTETGQLWPVLLWGGANSRLQLIAGDNEQVNALTLGNYMHNALQTVAGRNGGNTRALYSHIQQSVGGATENWNSTQDSFQIHPGPGGQGDLYLSYWLKFQPDLQERMTQNGWSARVVSDWKTGTGTGGSGGGDYRIVFSVFGDGDGDGDRLYWHIKGDNVANGGLTEQIFWEQTNSAVPVPVGRWFRVEVFVHRSSGSDGRVWVAVDGREIFDRSGSNMGIDNLPWNRIMPFLNYSTGQQLPAYQWVDDIELWDRFPANASPH